MSSSRGGETHAGGGRKRDPEEHQKQRRRALQARHRATLASLFETLKTVVCPTSNKTPAKWKILDHAKGFLREQESYLSRLLMLKGIYLGNEDGPRSLEEVREEYRNVYPNRSSYRSRRKGYRWPGPDEEEEGAEESSEEEVVLEEVMDESVPSQSSVSSAPNILEFEGYMLFYRQTVEKLVYCGVLGPGQTGLPVVSDAISGLWDSMSPERRAAYQSFAPQQGPPSWGGLSDRPPGSEPHLQTSQADSQGATASSTSTYEEDLLQDACDVMKKEMDSAAKDSYEADDSRQSGDLEKLREVVMGLVKTQTPQKQETPQNLSVTDNYDELQLRCSESFDSEDM
ncbi:stimulated by retinoic acid gene 8 protein-like isoform X2 [Osmerus eperlanus]|uniref:stimulated by retinoic acid gene 8 protein-like isoform X2 n=1 Tax=Osmerus eperlanus TaxID=29151 RepID=UPI002E125DAC